MIVYDDPETTASFIKEKLKDHPEDSFLWLYLAVSDYKMGKKDDALLEVQKSFKLYPSQESQYVYKQIMNNQPVDLISD